MAATIAAPWISPSQRRLPLLFPIGADTELRRSSWWQAADQLTTAVASGLRVVLLCEGDVSLYATASYVLLAVQKRHPHCPVRLIPGITSVAAAAAAAARPLVFQQETLLLRPTPNHPSELEALLDWAAELGCVLALLKLGHRWPWVRELLWRRQLLETSLFAQRVGWPDQFLASAESVAGEERPYFSLLLVRQGWPELVP
jgi:precorrin-2/cobalt-factor-2 C20-methyltransferase